MIIHEKGIAVRDLEVPLSNGGQRLWDHVTENSEMDEQGLSLLEEICRLKDRLDKMSGLIDNDSHMWALIIDSRNGGVELVIDKLFAEARMSAATFKALMGELRQYQRSARLASPRVDPQVMGGVDDLIERIRRRG